MTKPVGNLLNGEKMRGFSLLELSIVLAIIGLIAGGVVAGSSMIRAAEFRSVMTDLTKYKTAMYSFKTKYSELPGDMSNATRIWGAAHATHATCITTGSTGTETCDGNGDSSIGLLSSQYYESFLVWKHLANAKMIAGQYTGVVGSGGALHHVFGENNPASGLDGGGFAVLDRAVMPLTSTGYFPGKYGHVLFFGAQHGTFMPTKTIVTPEEMFLLDTKYDNGTPGNGTVKSLPATIRPNCASSDDPLTATYVLTESEVTCNILFNTGL